MSPRGLPGCPEGLVSVSIGVVQGFVIRAAATAHVVATAARLGVSPDVLSSAAGTPPLPENLQESIPLAQHFAVWDAAMRLADDPSFPVRVGATLPIEAFDVVGYAARSAPDLGEAIATMNRYAKVYANDTAFEMERTAETLSMSMPPSGPLPLAARAATEQILVYVVALCRGVTGARIVPLDVTYRHAAPPDVSAHEAHFGRRPRFGQPRTSLVLAAADLARATLGADPGLHRVLLRHAEDALGKLPKDGTLAGSARDAIRKLLPGGDASLERVAQNLACSPRTLRRRLADDGTSFGELRDTVRRELSLRYVEEPGLDLEQIAFLVGFSDGRAFRRAFRRWTGQPPRAHRAS